MFRRSIKLNPAFISKVSGSETFFVPFLAFSDPRCDSATRELAKILGVIDPREWTFKLADLEVDVAYGVQPGQIRRIYTDNSVYIIRCAVWRVSKIGRGLFSLVIKTPGCYNGIRGNPGFDSQYARISPAGSDVSLLCIPPGDPGGIVAYGVQPGRIRRIYTDNSVYIIRGAVWRVSKIGRGLFCLVVKTPGCYSGADKVAAVKPKGKGKYCRCSFGFCWKDTSASILPCGGVYILSEDRSFWMLHDSVQESTEPS
jgi:hypothetical protein